MYRYAMVNGASVCIGVVELAGAVARPDYIPIAAYDLTLIGKKWTGSAWIVV